MTDTAATRTRDSDSEFESAKFRLEKARYHADVLKWIVVAIGAVISFYVIDYGKLELEKLRVQSEIKRELLNSYLRATETPEPDIWKRKLSLIVNLSNDDNTKAWAQRELEYINNFAALDALYRETLKVALQLVEPDRINELGRIRARVRYEQLYWADLPYADESPKVISAMKGFRSQLIAAEKAGSGPDAKQQWKKLNVSLLVLSKALRESTPKDTLSEAVVDEKD